MNKIVICFLFSLAFLNLIFTKQFEKCAENKHCGDSAVCYSLIENEKICRNTVEIRYARVRKMIFSCQN